MFGTKWNYIRNFSFPIMRRSGRLALCLSLCFALLLAVDSWAGVGGTISGTVTDSSGAAVVKADVTATNADTGISQTTATDDRGFYSFPNLPIGNYELQVASSGFRSYRKTRIVIDANSALRIDAVLVVGERTDTILIVDPPILIDTSSTQNGEVISGAQMTAVPLNGRSFTDLLALQPGVVPVTSITGDTVQDVGASVLSPSGDLNPGTISINGQREFANSFIVNGSDVEEDVNNGASVIPNLDSIAEFRILTNNFDAEYGEFSGGQINVITKSGANAFHGDGFEFLRNTDLDARNYFSPTRGTFDQNQFGGTFGGPIRKDKIFFFGDYQGTRSTQGVDTGQIPVPSVPGPHGKFIRSGQFVRNHGCQRKRRSHHRQRSGFCHHAFAKIRLHSHGWRKLLHARMCEYRPQSMRFSRSRDSADRVVHTSTKSPEIYSVTDQLEWNIFHIGIQPDFARR